MKATTGLRALILTVQKLTHVASATTPNLRLRVSTNGGSLEVEATSMDAYARVFHDASDSTTGVVYVARTALLDALRALKPRIAKADLTVTLATTSGGVLTVTVDGRSASVSTTSNGAPGFEDGHVVGWLSTADRKAFAEAPHGELSDLIRAVAMAASADASIPFLGQMGITSTADDVSADEVTFIATDRYRAHRGRVANPHGVVVDAAMMRDSIAAVVDLMDGMIDPGDDLYLFERPEGIIWQAGRVYAVVPNTATTLDPLPEVAHILNMDVREGCVVDTLACVDAAGVMVKALRGEKLGSDMLLDIERDGQVRFATGPAAAVDQVEALEAFAGEATIDGDYVTAGCEARYLLDALSGVREERARLSVARLGGVPGVGQGGRIRVTGADFDAVVMCKRLGDESVLSKRMGHVVAAERAAKAPRKATTRAAKPATASKAATAPKAAKPAGKPTRTRKSAVDAFAGADLAKISERRSARKS